ncbi:type I restriction-modification system subunit M [Candidatus Nitrosopelagicus sp.]|nr:type I restriction-modification system subunit M [Candidatus Nitrosopelagicus sp.]
MAIKKSQIYSQLWASCDEFRGGMDASQYKDYILSILFVKYLTDKYKDQKDSAITIPKGGSFDDMVSLKGKSDIGDGMNKIIAKLAEENGLKGIIDEADFDDSDKLGSGKEKVDKLSNLISIFQNENLDFSKHRSEGDDLLGDAYEYLMRNFATQSGKSKGQFYTPSEVSQVIAKVIGASNVKQKSGTVYDPTAGSGSLLLKVANETPKGITIYGQENDVATKAMAMMNMWIHNNVEADIRQGNTIANPLFKQNSSLKTFDLVVSNPPFSFKKWTNGIDPAHDEFGRFDNFGIPPKGKGDFAFLLHVIKSLKSNGKGAIILPHGVLFRGNVEGDIRKNLVKRGYIKGIIGLPPNLFYGTGIPASIIVIDKENAESRKGIFMINASKGFVKDGNKNRLQAKNIHKIVDAFTKQLEIPKFSRLIKHSEIGDEKNDYNLNIPRYIDIQEKEDIQDIEGHLKGGIPEIDIDNLEKYWKVYPSLRKLLFSSLRDRYVKLNINKSEIKFTIFEHDDLKKYLEKLDKTFDSWKSTNISLLEKLQVGSKPKELIHLISEDILEKYSEFVLVDKYDVYQKLRTYWEDVMQDDVYFISINGWNVSLYDIKDKKDKVKGWDSELIPKETGIIVRKYFAKQKEELDKLQEELDSISQQIQVMDEDNQGEEDLFSEVRNDEKISKKDIPKRIKEIKNEPEFEDELKILVEYVELAEKEKELKRNIKSAEKQLDDVLLKQYNKLKESEIREIVVHYKWLSTIHNSINKELERISHNLAERINDLAERYETPLPNLSNDVKDLSAKTDQHLENMGFKW